ncbi:MAG: hypothetical protein ACHQ9S_23735 [Candidatus Binatia bacterium]
MTRVAVYLWITVAAGAVIVPVVVVLVIHAGVRSLRHTTALYRSHFGTPQPERLFLASLAFYLTVLIVRSITLAIHFQVGGLHDIAVHGTHVHHLVWGILLLLIVGYLWLAQFGTGRTGASAWGSRVTAIMFGVGAALTLDEFALWLHLEDVYWSPEGRESIEALILFGGLLVASVRGGRFVRALIRDLLAAVR